MCTVNHYPGLGQAWPSDSTWIQPVWKYTYDYSWLSALTPVLAQYASQTFRVQSGPAGLQLELDIPGVEQKDVEVKFEQGDLKVSTKRFVLNVDKQVENNWSYTLKDADVANITSALTNGVLIITVPFKLENHRKIPVSVG